MADTKTSRICGLDLLRGCAVIPMVIYHGLFSLIYVFGVNMAWFSSPVLSDICVPLIGGSFVLISGISSRFSRSLFKRGFIVFAFGMVMTLVTTIVLPSLSIKFGILHLMGLSMILTGLLRPMLDKLPRYVGIAIFVVLFILTYNLPNGGWLGIKDLAAVQIQTNNPYLFPFGLLAPGFSSSDYYPLIPWFFLYTTGSYLGTWIKAGKAPAWLYPSRCKAVEWIGRHSLWIYVLHQPVIVGVLWLIFQLI